MTEHGPPHGPAQSGTQGHKTGASRRNAQSTPRPRRAHLLTPTLLVRFSFAVDLLLDSGDVHAAQDEFALLSPKAPQDERYAPLETRLRATERADTLPDAGAIRTVVEAQPDNLQARLDLAQQYIAAQDYEAALEQLLAIVERDRAFRDDIARKTMVSVFDMMRDAPQAVSHWRRQLASKLN